MKWLKNLLRNAAGRIYTALGGDVLQLTRKAHCLLLLRAPVIDPEAEKDNFLAKMTELADSKELAWLFGEITKEQARMVYEDAKSYEDINLARGTTNGLLLVQERLRQYKTEYMPHLPEKFDKFAGI